MPPMSNRYERLVQRLREAVLTGAGVTAPELRRAVEARAALLGGAERSAEPVPEEAAELVDKVARHAFRIGEQDIAAVRRAGYSEEAVFEVAVSAAVGAGLARLERGVAALKGQV